MTLQEILALLANRSELSDTEVGELEAALLVIMGELETAATEDGLTPELLDEIDACAGGIRELRTEADTRIQAATAEAEAAATVAAERQAKLDAIRAEIHGTDDAEAEEVEVEPTAEAEAEVVAEAEAAAAEAAEAPAPVVAAAAPAAPRPLGQITPPVKHQAKQFATPAKPKVKIKAAGGRGEFTNRVEVEDAMLEAFSDTMSSEVSGRVRVAQFQADFAQELRLPEGRVTEVNDLVLSIREAALSSNSDELDALTADGGLCAPTEVYYDLTTISQAGRPLRGSLPSRQLSRGGIKYNTPMTLADIAATTTPTSQNAIGVISEAQDAAATYNKTYQTIACGTEVEVKVDAVYRQLEFGNLVARTNPERVSQFTDLSIAAFARFNELRVWNRLIALSTDSNAPQKYGAMRDLLTGLNRAAINYRAVHRMAKDATVEVRLPAWVGMGLVPDDSTNALQSYTEQFEMTATELERLLSLRGIRVAAWVEDEFTTAIANAGSINSYPSAFKVVMSHPGAFLYLDQGTLDLGIVRDGTLVNDNKFRVFMEEFYAIAMIGVQAVAIEFSLCASGASAGSVTPKCGS